MASRAVSKVRAMDWSKLQKSLSPLEQSRFNKLKAQIDSNVVKASSLPDSLPKIDWAFYKSNASNPKIVEEIEKQYQNLKIDPPKAPASRLGELDQAKKDDEARLARFLKIAESYAESAEIVKSKFEKMIPVKDMTYEDWTLTFPMWSMASIENPTISHYARAPGLTLEEQIAFEQPDPVPFATKTAWKDWEKRKAKFYSPAT